MDPYWGDHPRWRELWAGLYESGAYARLWHRDYPSQELVATIAALALKAPATALDLGCGAGSEAIFLAGRGLDVIAVDLCQQALDLATRRAEAAAVAVNFQCADVLRLPIRDASIDFANDRGCLHHIPQGSRFEYAAEIARVLKPGGRLLLRACRLADTPPWIAVTEQEVRRLFGNREFHVGSVLPFEFDAVVTVLPAVLAVIERL
jgi:ubiquinone/menaquinone biosynthesis C-methylase UbiE